MTLSPASSAPAAATDPATSGQPIFLLSAAAFAATASLRVADPLLPRFAEEFGVTAGAASAVVTSSAIAYAVCQMFYGPIGDRFGKYRVIALMALLAAFFVAGSAVTESLSALALMRLFSGATAAAVIPLSMAYIGDVVPYMARQPVLARFISGQILGIVFGQAVGGVFADTLGWRAMFAVLGTLFLCVDLLLWRELSSRRVIDRSAPGLAWRALPTRYIELLHMPGARRVLATILAEGLLFFGGFTFMGAFVRQAFGVSYSIVGVILACFGLGGLAYALAAKSLVRRLGEGQMAIAGGAIMAASFLTLAITDLWWSLPVLAVTSGLGFYLFHNTLQTNATQMAPHARGIAVSVFSSLFYLGQAIGVTLCGRIIDLVGYRPVFACLGAGLLILGLTYGLTAPSKA